MSVISQVLDFVSVKIEGVTNFFAKVSHFRFSASTLPLSIHVLTQSDTISLETLPACVTKSYVHMSTKRTRSCPAALSTRFFRSLWQSGLPKICSLSIIRNSCWSTCLNTLWSLASIHDVNALNTCNRSLSVLVTHSMIHVASKFEMSFKCLELVDCLLQALCSRAVIFSRCEGYGPALRARRRFQ